MLFGSIFSTGSGKPPMGCVAPTKLSGIARKYYSSKCSYPSRSSLTGSHTDGRNYRQHFICIELQCLLQIQKILENKPREDWQETKMIKNISDSVGLLYQRKFELESLPWLGNIRFWSF